MDFLRTLFSFLADIFGIIGFILTIFTYSNTRKIKSNDYLVSFRLEKGNILTDLQKNLDTLKKYSGNSGAEDENLPFVIQAMEEVITSVKGLNQYAIWNPTSKKAFRELMASEMQIKKIKAAQNANPEKLHSALGSNSADGMFAVLKKFDSQLEEIIHIVEAKT